MGVELLNDDSAMADAEIIAMTVKVMLDAGLTDFQISIGHVGFFQALAEESCARRGCSERIKELISIKNHFGAEELLAKQNLRSDLFEALRDVPQLFGNAEILEKAKGLTRNPAAREALDRLATIYEIVKDYGYEKYVFFDLGLLSKFHYYTGIIFQAYTYGTGEPIVKGGRYDALLQHFGKKAPAIGFCTVMESLMNALERQKISLPIANTKTMLLYPDFLQPLAVKLANEHRSKGHGCRAGLLCKGTRFLQIMKNTAERTSSAALSIFRRAIRCLLSICRQEKYSRWSCRRGRVRKDEIFDHCTDKGRLAYQTLELLEKSASPAMK